jgi:hypothetical protein
VGKRKGRSKAIPVGRKAIEDTYSFGDFNGFFHKYYACLYYYTTTRTRRFSPSALRKG